MNARLCVELGCACWYTPVDVHSNEATFGVCFCVHEAARLCVCQCVFPDQKIQSHCLSPRGDDVILRTARSEAGEQLTLLTIIKSDPLLAAAA